MGKNRSGGATQSGNEHRRLIRSYYETTAGGESFEKKFLSSFLFFFFCCIVSFHVAFHVLWSTSRRQRSKAFSSLCARSCAPSACGWRGDESVNGGRFRRSLLLSEAGSVAVITANLLCHSAAISPNAFISFTNGVSRPLLPFQLGTVEISGVTLWCVFRRRPDHSLSPGVSGGKDSFEG